MIKSEIISNKAIDLLKSLRARKISVREITDAFINQIDKFESDIKAWEFFDRVIVREYADELDSNWSRYSEQNLYGIPVGVKDIFNTIDYATEMGSGAWRGYQPGNDARVVHSIREDKGIIFGKTVTAEFAVHYLSAEKTKNPYNKNHIPGTSSSGSAAAVSTKMVPIALGTQTAGSIIRPASYCGVYGFKPSFGLIPRTGVLKTTDSLDTVGFFANSIEDCKLIFESNHVRGRDYPFVQQYLNPDFKNLKNKKLKVGILDKDIFVFDLFSNYSKDIFQDYISNLSKNKHFEIENIKISKDWNLVHQNHSIIYDTALRYYFNTEFQDKKDLLSPMILEAIEKGKNIKKEDYHEALKFQVKFRKNSESILSKYDLILTLSTAGEAPLIGETERSDTCLIWTFLGTPSLNIPIFKGSLGLPFGLQVIAPRYKDYELLEYSKLLVDP